jgi:hypothetical protein
MGKATSALGGLALTAVELAGLGLLAWGVTGQSSQEEQVAGEAGPTLVESRRQAVRQVQSKEVQARQELAQACAELIKATGTTGVGGSGQGQAAASAIHTGKVRSVSGRQLVLLDDSGQPITVEVGDQTRFISKGQRISAEQLKPGTPVRVTVDLLSGRSQAKEVSTLPAQ